MARFHYGVESALDPALGKALRELPDHYHVLVGFNVPRTTRIAEALVLRLAGEQSALFMVATLHVDGPLRGQSQGTWELLIEEDGERFWEEYIPPLGDTNPLLGLQYTANKCQDWIAANLPALEDPLHPWRVDVHPQVFPRLLILSEDPIEVERHSWVWYFDDAGQLVEHLEAWRPRDPFPVTPAVLRKLIDQFDLEPEEPWDDRPVDISAESLRDLQREWTQLGGEISTLRKLLAQATEALESVRARGRQIDDALKHLAVGVDLDLEEEPEEDEEPVAKPARAARTKAVPVEEPEEEEEAPAPKRRRVAAEPSAPAPSRSRTKAKAEEEEEGGDDEPPKPTRRRRVAADPDPEPEAAAPAEEKRPTRRRISAQGADLIVANIPQLEIETAQAVSPPARPPRRRAAAEIAPPVSSEPEDEALDDEPLVRKPRRRPADSEPLAPPAPPHVPSIHDFPTRAELRRRAEAEPESEPESEPEPAPVRVRKPVVEPEPEPDEPVDYSAFAPTMPSLRESVGAGRRVLPSTGGRFRSPMIQQFGQAARSREPVKLLPAAIRSLPHTPAARSLARIEAAFRRIMPHFALGPFGFPSFEAFLNLAVQEGVIRGGEGTWWLPEENALPPAPGYGEEGPASGSRAVSPAERAVATLLELPEEQQRWLVREMIAIEGRARFLTQRYVARGLTYGRPPIPLTEAEAEDLVFAARQLLLLREIQSPFDDGPRFTLQVNREHAFIKAVLNGATSLPSLENADDPAGVGAK